MDKIRKVVFDIAPKNHFLLIFIFFNFSPPNTDLIQNLLRSNISLFLQLTAVFLNFVFNWKALSSPKTPSCKKKYIWHLVCQLLYTNIWKNTPLYKLAISVNKVQTCVMSHELRLVNKSINIKLLQFIVSSILQSTWNMSTVLAI